MEKKLSRLILLSFKGLFFITPLLMFHKTSELFEFNKMLFIYLVATAVATLWIAKIVVSGKIRIAKTILGIPFASFFLALSISSFFSIDQHTSLFGYYGRFNGGLLSIGTYIFLFYAFVSNIEKEEVLAIIKVSLAACLYTILWGLPGVFGYDLTCLVFTGTLSTGCWTAQFDPTVRMFSTLGQPNWFGAYVAVHFFLGLDFFLKADKKSKAYVLWILFEVLLFSAVLLTRSRSALLALIIGMSMFVFFVISLKKKVGNDVVRLILLLLIPLFILKTGIPRLDKFLSLPTSKQASQIENVSSAIPGVTDSLDIRKIVWKGGIALGKKYPLFGSGVETFGYAYYQTRPVEHNLTSEWDFLYNKAHNEYINYFATTGFFGFGAYLVMILIFLYWVYKEYSQSKDDRLLLVSVTCAYSTILITNFVGFSTTVISLFFYLLPAFLFTYFEAVDAKTIEIPELLQSQQNKRLLFILPLLIFISGLYYICSYFFADISYALGESYNRAQEYEQAATYYENSLSLRDEHIYHDHLSQTLANRAFIEGFADEKSATVASLIKESRGQSEKALTASPKNPLYWRTNAKNNYLFFQLTHDRRYFAQALESVHKAQKIAPTDPRLFYMEALFYASQERPSDKDLILAQELLDRTIKLKPNYRDAYFLKGTAYKKQKNIIEAKKMFELILSKIQPGDSESNEELKNLK